MDEVSEGLGGIDDTRSGGGVRPPRWSTIVFLEGALGGRRVDPCSQETVCSVWGSRNGPFVVLGVP